MKHILLSILSGLSWFIGLVTLSNMAFIVGILAGIISILASFKILPTYKKKK